MQATARCRMAEYIDEGYNRFIEGREQARFNRLVRSGVIVKGKADE